MATNQHLIFSRRNRLLAIDARVVRETIRLPEITPVEEAPPAVTGVINLRGKIIPIIDLGVYFGCSPRIYHVTDYVIVIGREGPEAGVIVEDVHDVIPIPPEAVEPPVSPGDPNGSRPRVIAGEAKAGGDIIMLLDHTLLLELGGRTTESTGSGPGEQRPFRPEATAEDMAVFHRRAMDLLSPQDGTDNAGMTPMAAVLLGRECFGVDLGLVREFTLARNITPLPSCPEHVIGAMNLRGNILTIVDIRGILGMPIRETDTSPKVIVASVGEDQVGVAVDDILDIICLDPSALTPSPLAKNPESEKYLRGTVPYAGKVLTILDLARILSDGDLVVNEEA